MTNKGQKGEQKVVAVIGAGRMGAIVGKQLPEMVSKIVIDHNGEKAKSLAFDIGGLPFENLEATQKADVIAVVLPKPAIESTMLELAKIAKDDAIILNMATSATVNPEIVTQNPRLHFVEAKIIGHATSMGQGSPCYVVLNTSNETILETVQEVLPGFAKVLKGNVELVPLINSIGSKEGIRAAIEVRKQLHQYQIPKEWEDIVIYTVCAGTMRSYVKNDLGHFAQKIADELEKNRNV